MRTLVIIVGWLIFAASAALAWDLWTEAHLPMTTERYVLLCNNEPECYPEYFYFFGAAIHGLVALCVGIALFGHGLSYLTRWRRSPSR